MQLRQLFGRQAVAGKCLASGALAVVAMVGVSADARAQSGQRVFAQAEVEPAINDANGSTVFLLTPLKSPFPSKSNPVASAPMYLPVYPTTSTVDASSLNCQPFNCDHVNVVPFPAPGYVNGGNTCTKYGFQAGQCALTKGHDHLIGVAPTGDFNVAWHVYLVVFTKKAFADGAIGNRLLTLQDIQNAVQAGDVYPPEVTDSGIMFNCSIVSSTVYFLGTPLDGF
ncbi:MAG: hypothetical protein ACM3NQ_21110 [Bacteroidales bacterium]